MLFLRLVGYALLSVAAFLFALAFVGVLIGIGI